MTYEIFKDTETGLFGFRLRLPPTTAHPKREVTRVGFYTQTDARFAAQHFGYEPQDPDRIPAGLTDSTALADVRWPYGWNETKQDRPIHNGPES